MRQSIVEKRFSYYDINMRKMNGKPVSEEQVDAWVAEAEAGYDVELLRKKGRPARGVKAAKVVTLRLNDEESRLLDRLAREQQTNRSEILRKALTNYAQL